MTVLKFSKGRTAAKAVATNDTTPAAIIPLPVASAAVNAVVAKMEQHKIQKPARAELRATLKARAKDLKALGVDEDAIAQDALAFAQAVRGQLLHRKRIAGAIEQIEDKLATRIGERRAAAPMLAMPRRTPPEPHFRIHWPSKVTLHATFRDHRAVERHVDGLMRMTAGAAERHIGNNLEALGQVLKRLGIYEATITNFTRDFESRVRAAYWRRVMLLDQPRPKGSSAS